MSTARSSSPGWPASTCSTPAATSSGKVRDAVTMLRADRQPPRVLGLVIEVAQRHRIFVPMGRVTRIEPDAGRAVLRHGEHEALRAAGQRGPRARRTARPHRHHPRDGQAGQRRRRRHGAEPQPRLGDLPAGGAHAGRPAGPPARAAVPGRLERGRRAGRCRTTRQGTDALLAMLSDLRAADVATALQDMPDKRRLEVAAAPGRRAAGRRPAGAARGRPGRRCCARWPTSAPPTCSRRWTTTTPPTCSARCPRPTRSGCCELMEPEEAAPVRRLMTYGDYTAGGLMTSEPVIMLPDATVAEALARVRNPELSPAIAAQVFVVRPPQATPTGRFLGTAHLQRLLREPPSALVSGVVRQGHRRAAPDAPIGRGHPPPGHLQPGRRAGRRRARPAARRGLGRRRARPPAARGLARHRPRRARRCRMAESRAAARPAPGRAARPARPATTPRPSGARPSGSPGSSAPAATWSYQIGLHPRSGSSSTPCPGHPALRPVPVHVPDPDPVAAGRLRRAADPARAEPAGRPRPRQPRRRPRRGPRSPRPTSTTSPARSPRSGWRSARSRPATSCAPSSPAPRPRATTRPRTDRFRDLSSLAASQPRRR